jgi:membrane protein required for beta-lactamase induction
MGMALDAEARTAALRVRGLCLLPLLLFAVLLLIFQTVANVYVAVSLMLAVVSFIYGTFRVRKAFIEAVWRGKSTTHRKLYESNKAYFDGRFARYGLREEKK